MKMSQKKRVLKLARKIVAKKGAWTQGYFARDIKGGLISELHPKAVSFCMSGAIFKAAHDLGFDSAVVDLAREAIYPLVGGTVLGQYNDRRYRTQDDVVEVFDKAIEATS